MTRTEPSQASNSPDKSAEKTNTGTGKPRATGKPDARATGKPKSDKSPKKSEARWTTAKVAGAKKSTKPRFSPEFLEEMRRRLLAERARYLHSAEEYRAEADSLLETREPGDVQFDEEGGEGTTLAVERDHDIALSNQARETVEQIDAALERLDNGTYGLCVTSGAPIPQARLRAIPWAAQRVEVKAGGLGRY